MQTYFNSLTKCVGPGGLNTGWLITDSVQVSEWAEQGRAGRNGGKTEQRTGRGRVTDQTCQTETTGECDQAGGKKRTLRCD